MSAPDRAAAPSTESGERSDQAALRALLVDARARTARLVDVLADELDQLIDSTDNVGNDDEHDPDGSTSGYERAKTTSLLDVARSRLREFDDAFSRLDRGTYGLCRQCGAEIGLERLEALPHAATCIGCARRSAAGRA